MLGVLLLASTLLGPCPPAHALGDLIGALESSAEPRLPDCASPLMTKIFEATRTLAVEHGNGDPGLYATGANWSDPNVYQKGPEIFPKMADMIAAANEEVLFQTYVWEDDSQAVDTLLDGIRRLQERRKREAPGEKPVNVRIILDAARLGFGSPKGGDSMPALRARLEAMGIDPNIVKVDIAAYQHLTRGVLHTKAMVIDGETVFLTGANPQKHHEGDNPWYDLGFVVGGEIGRAARAEFNDTWTHSDEWICNSDKSPAPGYPAQPKYDRKGARKTPNGQFDCWRKGEPLVPLRLNGISSACMPMLITTRKADGWPFDFPAFNKLDNTQDGAFFAAVQYAEQRIKIQTPNLNDPTMLAELDRAIRSGVPIDIVLPKGFNDASKKMPLRCGTNVDKVNEMYDKLRDVPDICDKLRVRWYSQDGEVVLGNGPGGSHAKYMSVDGQVTIMGSGNMDCQAIRNSREVNIVVDDAPTTQGWAAQFFDVNFANGTVVEPCR